MKSLTLSCIVLLSAALCLTSCDKRGEFEVDCKIARIISNYHQPDWDVDNVATFSYNGWGDPVSIIQSNMNTGRPHMSFSYDNKRRLTFFMRYYHGGGSFEFLHKYVYDNSNRIVRDTTYYMGTISNPTAYSAPQVNTYTYDAKGRISKVRTTVPASPGYFYDQFYNYDARGNRIWDFGDNVYDNKPSYMRTSLVFAFVARDYSVNNRAGALSYNRKGLPLAFPPEAGRDLLFIYDIPITNIEYTCDGNGHGHH